MTKYLSRLAMVAFSFTFVGYTNTVFSKSTIIVNSKHCQLSQPEGIEAPPYVISSSDSLLVDTRQFNFKTSFYPDVKPNIIHLIVGDRQYFATWQSSGLTTLNTSTLQPVGMALPFSGLKPGDSAVIAIGSKHIDIQKNEIVLKVLWAGLIKVKLK